MENKVFTIKIESILGGQSEWYGVFSRPDQFQVSYSIDPDGAGQSSPIRSGYICPGHTSTVDNTTLIDPPLWMISSPKNRNLYVYGSAGSVHTTNAQGSSLTALGDLTDEGTALGNGAEYYDNYIYFARSTTVARYGPLDGTAAFTDDYWVGTLSKTALSNTLYPFTGISSPSGSGSINFPNHVMYRHSDGRLYFADVVGNQGYLHFIQTTKTSVEGDTDNGSTYQKLAFGYGLYPTSIAPYGSDLVIALYEGVTGNIAGTVNSRKPCAKLAFWDTTSQNANKITWVEFPDPFISAMINRNGVLYTFSGEWGGQTGIRVCRFVGGYSFEQVAYIPNAKLPLQGAVDGILNKIFFGSSFTDPTDSSFDNGCVWSIGTKRSQISNAVFNVMGCTGTTNARITSISLLEQTGLDGLKLVTGWSGDELVGIDRQGTSSASPAFFRSQVFRIGQPFKITKVRIPLAEDVNSAHNIVPRFYIDEEYSSTTLTTINNTNYSGEKNIVIRPQNLTGKHSFNFELKWGVKSGDNTYSNSVVALPITIEYELIDD